MKEMLCITGIATANGGIRFTHEKFNSEEKEKCYWLNGGSRRVNKEQIMKPYTNKQIDLLTYPKITYVIWCFPEFQHLGLSLLNSELVKVILQYKQATDSIVNAVFKQVTKPS